MATKVIVCPPPPPPPSPQLQTNSTVTGATVTQVTAQASQRGRSDLQGFASQPWQGWFSQVYNQIKTQFVNTTFVADGALVNANAALAAAAAAQADVAHKLTKDAADILTGATSVTTTGGIVAGSLTWDASGNRTGGYGVAMTSKGLVGFSSSTGVASFAISSTTGDATFAGTLSAANGTFTGTLVATNGTFTGTLVSVNGTFVGTLNAATFVGGTVTGALIRTSNSFPRTEINATGLQTYDGSGNTIVTADGSGVSSAKPAGAVAAAVLATSASNSAAALQASCTGSAPAAQFFGTGADALSLSATGNAITITGGGNGISQTGGGANFLSTVAPRIDNSFSLGTNGALRWTAVYAMSSTITTSDVRTKNRIETLQLGLDFVKTLRPVQYFMNVSHNQVIETPRGEGESPDIELLPMPGKRLHYGFPAQEVKQALTACGVDDAALWALSDPEDPESQQALRYEEFVPVLWRAVQQLTARVEALEAAAAAVTGGA